MNVTGLWTMLKDAGSGWVADKGPRLGAALAYYTAFALSPLLVLAIGLAGLVFGQEQVQAHVMNQVHGVIGEQGGQAIGAMVTHAHGVGSGIVAATVGIVLLLFGAGGLFGSLQDALNTIWGVEPKSGRGIWGIIRDRFLSFSMVLGCGFLLLVSLLVSAALAALMQLLGDWQTGLVGHALYEVTSLIVFTLLFAMIFRFLPDVRISWRDVWLGAALTALLFEAGKFLIGLYLGHSSIASSYGAAGSLAVLLVWLYYAAQVFLFGAELTRAYANRFGTRIKPTENAVPLSAEARAEQGIPEGGNVKEPKGPLPRKSVRTAESHSAAP
jgi:membrane protein